MDDIQIDRVGQALGKTPLAHPDPANTSPQGGSDATVEVEFADILSKARQVDETDAEAMQKARELLRTAQLTSEENLRATAEDIVTFGF